MYQVGVDGNELTLHTHVYLSWHIQSGARQHVPVQFNKQYEQLTVLYRTVSTVQQISSTAVIQYWQFSSKSDNRILTPTPFRNQMTSTYIQHRPHDG